MKEEIKKGLIILKTGTELVKSFFEGISIDDVDRNIVSDNVTQKFSLIQVRSKDVEDDFIEVTFYVYPKTIINIEI